MTTKLTNVFRKFHSDEEGLEALQVVMIIAIAAVILVAAGTVGQSVVDFTKKSSTPSRTNRSTAKFPQTSGGPASSSSTRPPDSV